MTDVPGHTIGIVPLLAKHGIEFLHIGVNPATPVPNVPTVFRWQHGADRIVVMYNGDYGETVEIGDFAVAFGFTGDNRGPQGGDCLKEVYDRLQAKYPSAVIRAATLDDVAMRLREIELPVVEAEIGDSWIHGVGADPTKTAAFRALLRRNMRNDTLLQVPEHTWGMDLKTHFHNVDTWLHGDVLKCEAKSKIEHSWQEQRDYVFDAAAEMGVDLSEELTVTPPDVAGMCQIEDTPSVELSYELFDQRDYDRFRREYLRLDVNWSQWDLLKAGLPEYKGGIFTPSVTGAWGNDDTKIFLLEFDEAIRQFAGLPKLYVIETEEQVEVRWFGKQPNRLPEAFWLHFPQLQGDVELYKLGQWIDPKNSVGMKDIHAVWSVRTDELEIETLDAPLAAPFGRQLLKWKHEPTPPCLYFNLYNNVWNTNFPMWFSDDAKFRFRFHART